MSIELPSGLSQQQAAARLSAEGPNELGTDQRRNLLSIAVSVLREPMFLLLLGAGAIYLTMGDPREALILLGFVFIIISITVLQERHTERALESLRDLSSPRALVIRDGKPVRIAGREVVREDILMLAEGDRVPADGLLLQAHELAVDESMLTGESAAVAKFADGSEVFAGTLVVRGQGLIQVSAIGKATQIGHIGQSLQDISLQSAPLQAEIARLTRRLAVIGAGLCVFLTLLYQLLRGGWLEALLAGITLAMGILPQELPVIMIVFLALGARRIARHQVLTRRLSSIETLGQTSVLCVDKTGTLTHNRMQVAALCVAGEVLDVDTLTSAALPEEFHELLEYAVLASEIEPHDPMEQAFHRFAHDYLANTEHLHPDWLLVREYELSPAQLAMSHLWQEHAAEPAFVATKGAPEAIVDLCHLSPGDCQQVLQQAEQLAERGLRVLGVAKARHPPGPQWPEIQHDFALQYIGLLGLADPLRDDVPAAIAECQRAGIRLVMITGDHPRTARAIAAAAGIASTRVCSGRELAAMDASQLADCLRSTSVFARVSPQQKLALVESLKASGEVVAMTGDGVNDAPALKAAHIGIAMGKRGTDVAREAAALVLLDDDFSAIVAAIRRGRKIFANLRQALIYTIAVHMPIIGLSLMPVLLGLPLLLAPIHIALLELLINPACSIVFEAENGRGEPMRQPPRALHEPLVSMRHIALGMLQGLGVSLVVVALYHSGLANGMAQDVARGLAFITLVVANTGLILANRSPVQGWRSMLLGLSRVGGWVLAGTLAMLLLVTAITPLARVFAFQPASIEQWLVAFAYGAALLLYFEIAKIGMRLGLKR
ncbi:cation-translocating P-type ATPase [Pseudomonas sp. SA3-5]|uniref:Cation-translocating P-type ATPase n=1 Tax=Pseudomonas aestuarii TaxID=3018340 RepID=A0ABT4XIB4_9PSED|nr:cation-translocating P-type ATPase [Pseudomonas aestuarii]MDA7087945.1 cation-translocating P-type ATPase [Pseudomonas aestuarii]